MEGPRSANTNKRSSALESWPFSLVVNLSAPLYKPHVAYSSNASFKAHPSFPVSLGNKLMTKSYNTKVHVGNSTFRLPKWSLSEHLLVLCKSDGHLISVANTQPQTAVGAVPNSSRGHATKLKDLCASGDTIQGMKSQVPVWEKDFGNMYNDKKNSYV